MLHHTLDATERHVFHVEQGPDTVGGVIAVDVGSNDCFYYAGRMRIWFLFIVIMAHSAISFS